MRIAIFGAGGQLGRELARAGVERGLELLLFERRSLDITDFGALDLALKSPAISAVVNAAGYTAVDRAESEPERALAVNQHAPARMAEICAALRIPLFHVSTDYVFDGSKRLPYTEADPVAPLSVYGLSKEAGEREIRALAPKHVILRTSWLFSSHGHNFVKTMLRLAAEQSELRVVADQTGRPTSAKDLARALLGLVELLGEHGELPWGTYHFAGAEPTSWHGLAVAVFELSARFGGKQPIVRAISTADYPTPARRPRNSVLDTSLFERTFGIHPRPWREGLTDVIAELQAAAAQRQI